MQHNQIVGLSLLIIGIIIIIIFGLIIIIKKRKHSSSFDCKNQESQGIWDFTKKNFPIFITLFGVIIALYGIVMLCQ